MGYSVYILQSLSNGDIYVGSTRDFTHRIALHNNGRVKSTSGYRPWRLLEVHEFKTRNEAVRAEKFYKQHQQKEIIKRRYGLVAKQ